MTERRQSVGPKRLLYLAAGWFSLALAAIGAVLPILPTAPFVLVAAACFARSSPQLHRWLRESRWFGPPVRAWEDHRAVHRRTKILAIGVLWVTLPVSIALIGIWWVRGLLALVLVVATVLIVRLPTLEQASDDPVSRSDR